MKSKFPDSLTFSLLLVSIFFLGACSSTVNELHGSNAIKSSPAPVLNASCEKKWNLNWEKAKQGDREARSKLLQMVLTGQLVMPGSGEDVTSRTKDLTILAVHTSDYKKAEGLVEIAENVANITTINWKSYRTCRADNNKVECSKLAVSSNLVPSFEKYANEIDQARLAGSNFQCPIHKEAIDISQEVSQ